MILVVDMGNSNIFFGVYEKEKLLGTWRINTNRGQSEDQYVLQFRDLLTASNIQYRDFEGVILSSVVPPLTLVLFSALEQLTGLTPMLVGPGLKTGLAIKSDNPNEVGADLVIGAVAALDKYPKPAIVVDLGTATKLYVLDKEGAFVGALIIPGVRISAEALSRMATQLPYISLVAPAKVVGKNTPDSMNSGLIYGTAEMIDGLIRRIEEELGYTCQVIMTGGLSRRISPHCRRKHSLNETLLLEGLRLVYERNQKSIKAK